MGDCRGKRTLAAIPGAERAKAERRGFSRVLGAREEGEEDGVRQSFVELIRKRDGESQNQKHGEKRKATLLRKIKKRGETCIPLQKKKEFVGAERTQ